MKILMESRPYTIIKLLKKTKAKFASQCRMGDVLTFSVPVEASGTGRGIYATYITVTNTTLHIEGKFSFNQVMHIFDLLELAPDYT